jgi:hypothetical protein
LLKCKPDDKFVVMWTWLNRRNTVPDKDNASYVYIM